MNTMGWDDEEDNVPTPGDFATSQYAPSIPTGAAPISQSSQSTIGGGRAPPVPPSESDVEGMSVDGRAPLMDLDDEDEDYGSDDDALNAKAKELPSHACRYCCYHEDPCAMVRCGVCKKWFCNSSQGTRGSHIITHLVKSRHKEICLHEDSPLGDAPLECYVCGSKNIFLLGFIPSTEDSVVVLICREPCLQSSTLKDMNWDADGWQPLIEDRQLLPWLVKVPQPKELGWTRHLTNSQLDGLEKMWKTSDGDVEDLQAAERSEMLNNVPFNFKDGFEFRDVYEPLLNAECETSKELKEQLQQDNISISWTPGLEGKKVAKFGFPTVETKLAIGDEIMLIHNDQQWTATGLVTGIAQQANTNDEVSVEIRGKDMAKLPSNISGGFSVKFVFKATTFERMRTAMKNMAKDETSLSAFLYHSILGHQVDPTNINVTVPKKLTAPGLNDLNHSQTTAVGSVLRTPLSLIQGPPGTGKTTTSATLVYHMSKLNNAQVLVCSPSNVAVDQLAERIEKTGLNVVRLSAVSREGLTSSIDHLMLHRQVKQFCESSPQRSEMSKLYRLKQLTGDLSDRDKRRFISLIRKVEEDLISAADVVCCTCSGAGDKRLSKIRFKHVLIDESTQATEPETLIPIVMGAKQLVLVGDHCQMGPVVVHRQAHEAGLGRSMFERLVYLGFRPWRLDVQYRMHPCLSSFSSNKFYDGALQNGVSAEDRDAARFFPWPNPRKPMFFYNSVAPEEQASTGMSYLNRNEAALAERFVTQLLRNGVTPDQVGVITPYEGQRAYLVNYLQRNGPLQTEAYERVEVASVDSFQGREKEFIILTCVRSNERQGIGFLSDWRRLNVALTRARMGVMIVGNARVLSQHTLWHELLVHFKNQSLIVDGPVTDMKPVNVALQKPKSQRQAMGPVDAGQPQLHSAMYHAPIVCGTPGFAPSESQSTTGSIQPYVDISYTPGMAPALALSAYAGAPSSQASMSGISQSQ